MSKISTQPSNVQYLHRSCSTDAWLGSVAHLMRSPRTIPRALWGALGPYEEPLRLVPSEKRGAAAAQPQPQPSEDDLRSSADGLQQEVRPQRCWATGKQKHRKTDSPRPSIICIFTALSRKNKGQNSPSYSPFMLLYTLDGVGPVDNRPSTD